MPLPESSHISESLSRTVIETVADNNEIEPTALPALYNSIDPTTLDSLFEQTEIGTVRRFVIEFVYDGSLVTVSVDDGFTISISEI